MAERPRGILRYHPAAFRQRAFSLSRGSLIASRSEWFHLSDDQLLSQCEIDTYRASGPGGQKRNKTSSAVRLRHIPSALLVIAEESRSQHANKAKALVRLRQAFILKVREPIAELSSVAKVPEIALITNAEGRLDVGRKDARFWPAVAIVLDVLDATMSRVSEAGQALGISTGNLIDFLQTEPKVWEYANMLRQRHGQKPLK